jgi:hypothetical protein
MMPCSFTPLIKYTVTGVLFLRTLLRKTSWTFCDLVAVIGSLLLGLVSGPADNRIEWGKGYRVDG